MHALGATEKLTVLPAAGMRAGCARTRTAVSQNRLSCRRISARARRAEDLTWDQWGKRAREFITLANEVFTPDLIIIGGGISKYWDEFSSHVTFGEVRTRRAALVNNAGIIGAAALAFSD